VCFDGSYKKITAISKFFLPDIFLYRDPDMTLKIQVSAVTMLWSSHNQPTHRDIHSYQFQNEGPHLLKEELIRPASLSDVPINFKAMFQCLSSSARTSYNGITNNCNTCFVSNISFLNLTSDRVFKMSYQTGHSVSRILHL